MSVVVFTMILANVLLLKSIRVYMSWINLPVIDWMFIKNVKKKQLKTYNINSGVCIFSQEVSIQIVSTCLPKRLLDGFFSALEYLGYNCLIPLCEDEVQKLE